MNSEKLYISLLFIILLLVQCSNSKETQGYKPAQKGLPIGIARLEVIDSKKGHGKDILMELTKFTRKDIKAVKMNIQPFDEEGNKMNRLDKFKVKVASPFSGELLIWEKIWRKHSTPTLKKLSKIFPERVVIEYATGKEEIWSSRKKIAAMFYSRENESEDNGKEQRRYWLVELGVQFFYLLINLFLYY